MVLHVCNSSTDGEVEMEIDRLPELDGWPVSLENQLVPGSVKSFVSKNNGACSSRRGVRKAPGMDLWSSYPRMCVRGNADYAQLGLDKRNADHALWRVVRVT